MISENPYRPPHAPLEAPAREPLRPIRWAAAAWFGAIGLVAMAHLYQGYSFLVRIGTEDMLFDLAVQASMLIAVVRGICFVAAAVLIARGQRRGLSVAGLTVAATAALDLVNALASDGAVPLSLSFLSSLRLSGDLVWYPLTLLALLLAQRGTAPDA